MLTVGAFVQLLRLCVPELKYVYKMRSVDRQYMCAACSLRLRRACDGRDSTGRTGRLGAEESTGRRPVGLAVYAVRWDPRAGVVAWPDARGTHAARRPLYATG